MDLAIKESIQDKCNRRDNQANIIMKIIDLAKQLEHCTDDLGKVIRYPEHINDRDIDLLRQNLDRRFWYQVLEENQIEKYLTTTDKNKLYEKMEEKTPSFEYKNVTSTINEFMTSKEATATNMIKKIYKELTDGHFRVGNKGNNPLRRDLQLEVPMTFRLSIFYCYSQGLPSYVSSSNSHFEIIDDFERACYLVDGKTQPDRQKSIESLTTEVLRKDELIVNGPYFKLQIFNNGNVKITMKSKKVLSLFNKWGRSEKTIESKRA